MCDTCSRHLWQSSFLNWIWLAGRSRCHYNDVIMSAMVSQITILTIVYSTVNSRHRSKENIKAPRHWPCEGNSPVTGEFAAQRASYAENVSIWWRHHHRTIWRSAIRRITAGPGELPSKLPSILNKKPHRKSWSNWRLYHSEHIA